MPYKTDQPLIEDPLTDPRQIVRRFRLHLGSGTWLSANLCVHHAGGGLAPATDQDLHALRHALEAHLPPHLQTPIDPGAEIPATREPTAAEEDWGVVITSEPAAPSPTSPTPEEIQTLARALSILKNFTRQS